MKKHGLLFILISLLMTSCNFITENNHSNSIGESNYSEESSMESSSIEESEDLEREKDREDRILSKEQVKPSNKLDSTNYRRLKDNQASSIMTTFTLSSGDYRLDFVKNSDGYSVDVVNTSSKSAATSEQIMFKINKPAKVYFKGDGQIESNYQNIEITEFGILATASVTSSRGTVVLVEDRYYLPRYDLDEAFNVQRLLKVISLNPNEKGYQSVFSIETKNSNTNNLEWFIPSNIFGELGTISAQPYKVFRETLTGLPLAMVRDKNTGYSVSLARFQPVIDYESNSYACVSAHEGTTSSGNSASSVEVTYPTRDTSRKYFNPLTQSQIVYDMTIIPQKNDSFQEAAVNCYSKQFTLQDQRIVNTDIDEVYKVINEDFKDFMLSNTRNGITSYGLPWRVTLDTGKIGPMSYQAGFVGQQIPCAYNMMLYGVKNNDSKSLQNGKNIINFWLHDAKMMNASGVPMIWYDGASNRWQGYPTFTRMAVDAMEGLFDAYRLASAHNITTTGWIEAVKACADWFVNTQNSDGSWYRCYNYEGTYYKGTESNITWNPGDITRSTSKNNSTMPVRFLGKMYEFTGDEKYLNAIKKAGDFIYEHIYPTYKYFGGTCDNPDSLDKEAGVYAMYCFDTLYTLTNENKWLDCLKYATIFTMSSVLTISYKILDNATDLKAANGLKYGYTDGLSYICCGGTALDNYAAYIYYELFRVYIYTGDEVFYDMAEFIQQNTKSTMDWDGTLDYAYKSLTPEASTIYSFGFASAEDDEGVDGVWLPWQSAANAEPIAKMYDTFGVADVKNFKETSNDELKEILSSYGVGGNAHRSMR